MRANGFNGRRQCFLLLWQVIAVGMSSSAGCSQPAGPPATEISGTVQFDGQPVRVGEIRFVLIEGENPSISGGRIRDGHYALSRKQRLSAGVYRVEIMGYRNPQDPRAEVDLHAADSNYVQYIPAKHNQNSQTTITIDSTDEAISKDFTLTK